MKKIVTILILVFTACVLSQPVSAQEEKAKEKHPWSKFQVSLGWYFAALDSNFRVGSSSVGVDVDVEELLGLESSTSSFRLGGLYRFGETGRHAVAADWFSFKRSGTKQLTEDIEFPPGSGNTVINGVTAESVFDFDLISTRYRYAIFLDNRMDLNVGAGLFVMPIKFGVGPQGTDFAQTSITAPLPTLGLGFDFAFTPKWFLRQSIDGLYLEYDNFNGSILDYQVAVEYRPWKNWSFGLGLESMSVKLQVKEETSYPGLDFDGSLGFGFNGIRLFMKYIIF